MTALSVSCRPFRWCGIGQPRSMGSLRGRSVARMSRSVGARPVVEVLQLEQACSIPSSPWINMARCSPRN